MKSGSVHIAGFLAGEKASNKIAWGGGQERGVKEVAKQMLFSPPLLAIGAAIYFQGTVFPSYIEAMLDKFQATLIPLVTTIVGMKLDFRAMPLYFKENMLKLC